ncbi:MAG: hypothetical protein ACEY3M_15860, partial [Wolbachia sp.]
TKGQAKLLGSCFKEFHLFAPGTTISHFQHRYKECVQVFAMSDTFCYCTDIQGLMSSLGGTALKHGDCSLIHLRQARRQYYYTVETDMHQYWLDILHT